MNLITRIRRAVWRRIDPSDKARIRRMMKHPPAVRKGSIVFVSSDDYSGNPKALFLYMIEHGYNKRYKMTWLFEKRENYFDFDIPGVRSVGMWAVEGENEQRSYESYRAVMSAGYVFYSHNVNWVKLFRPEQTFVDLWHGCGYKGDLSSDKRKIYYDYLMVTGRKYIDIFRDVLKEPDGNILDLGYPRNEMLFTSRSDAGRMLDELKEHAGVARSIIWMPTYRKSKITRLDTDTGLGETGLPVVYNAEALRLLDEVCRSAGVLLIIKQHLLQADYDLRPDDMTNVVFIDDAYLRSNNADLYELMGLTDALLTDYSSVAIDYMLLGRPIGYTLDDFDQYEEARGWSFDNVREYMPGHHIYNEEDLYTFIRDVAVGRDPYSAHREEILGDVQTYRDGFSRRILEYFGL